MLANHEDKKVNVGMELFECKRGQIITSLSKLSERWRVSRETTRHFLNLLEKDTMITTNSNTRFTQITICNYDNYNNTQHTEQTQGGHSVDAGLTPTDTTKEYKELEELKETIPPIPPPSVNDVADNRFEEVWAMYGRKGNKKTSEKKWANLKNHCREAALQHIPRYVASTPDPQYRKNFETYINQEVWNDEIVHRVPQAQSIHPQTIFS